MNMKHDCNSCFHQKVCKIREAMEKEKEKIDNVMEDVPLVYSSLEIKCNDLVSIQDIILKSDNPYLNVAPAVRPPYEITCWNNQLSNEVTKNENHSI